MKPQGGGSTPADDEELVIQTGCSGAASTFHFAGRFCFIYTVSESHVHIGTR